MKEITNLLNRSLKWRFKNPVTIIISLIQPIMWLLLFTTIFKSEDKNYQSFVIPGIIVMSILFGAGISGIANYSLKSSGSYFKTIIAPIKRSSIIIAHSLDSIITSIIQISIILIISFIMGVRIQQGIIGIIIIFSLLIPTIFFVANISYSFSLSIDDENGFIATVNTITLPLFFVSSSLTPKESLPTFLKFLASINPFTYIIDSIRNIMIEHSFNFNTYIIALVIILVLCIISLITTTIKLNNNH